MIRRIVRLEFHPDKVGEFLNFFTANRKTIASFPGVISLDFYKDASIENVYYTFSIWESEEAWKPIAILKFLNHCGGLPKQRFAGKPLAYSLAEVTG